MFILKYFNQAALGMNDCLCLSVDDIGARSGLILQPVLKLYSCALVLRINLLHG